MSEDRRASREPRRSQSWLLLAAMAAGCSSGAPILEIGGIAARAPASAAPSTLEPADAGAPDAVDAGGPVADVDAGTGDAGQSVGVQSPWGFSIVLDVEVYVREGRGVEISLAHAMPDSERARPYRGTITPGRIEAFRLAIERADVCGRDWGGGTREITIRSTLPGLCNVDVTDSTSRPEQRRRFNAVLKAMRQLQRDVCQGRCPQGLNGY